MSARPAQCWTFTCEGCGREESEHLSDALHGRLSLASKGWTFPPVRGFRGNLLSGIHDDVCPNCSPAWQPRQREKGQR